MVSLPDHRATFRVAFHTMGPRLPAKQIGPVSGRGSLKYVTEYMKRSTKREYNDAHPESS
jgi:hypothetical protein